jgi:hypothetical protein
MISLSLYFIGSYRTVSALSVDTFSHSLLDGGNIEK